MARGRIGNRLCFSRTFAYTLCEISTSDESKAEFGPIKIELGKLAREGHDAITNLSRLNVLMAETRLLELEITEGMFSTVFTDDQRARMKGQIKELRQLTRVSPDNAS